MDVNMVLLAPASFAWRLVQPTQPQIIYVVAEPPAPHGGAGCLLPIIVGVVILVGVRAGWRIANSALRRMPRSVLRPRNSPIPSFVIVGRTDATAGD